MSGDVNKAEPAEPAGWVEPEVPSTIPLAILPGKQSKVFAQGRGRSKTEKDKSQQEFLQGPPESPPDGSERRAPWE